MNRTVIATVVQSLLFALTPCGSAAWADEVTPRVEAWHLYGSNTLRYDNFNSNGDRSSSPYRFGGPQTYDELNLNFDREFSDYNRVSGSFSGLVNDSDYRSPFKGLVPERFNLRQENGDAPLAYRAEAGDLFAFLSYRSIQRSLKGALVEFQPRLGLGARHSLVLFSGSASGDWRNIQLSDGLSSGASWLLEHPAWGRLGLNLINNYKEANGTSLPLSTTQYVSSLAYENHLTLAAQQLTFEGEIGHFSGDHADLGGPGSGQDRVGNGYFAQLSGSPRALSALGYRLRFEDYDQDYRPDTASIQPDRRSREAHLSWRFRGGLTARGRLQRFRGSLETANPVDTDVYGVNLSGPLFPGRIQGLSGSVDAFRQINKSRDLGTSTLSRVLNASLNKTLNHSLSARAGVFYSNTRDRNGVPDQVSITRQYTAGLDYRFEVRGWHGVVSPGFVARQLSQAGDSNWEYNPTVNLNASRGPHGLSMSYSALDQNRDLTDLGVLTQSAGLNYRYDRGPYSLGLDANWFEREPSNGALRSTHAWRLGASFTVRFDRPAKRPAAAALHVSGAGGAATARVALDLTQLTPGLAEDQARTLTDAAGLGEPTRQPGLLIWFNRILRDVDENQRLAVEHRGGRLTRAALIIDFNPVGSPDGNAQTFERVRRELLIQYGPPDAFFDQGEFGPALGVDLAAGRFIRVMEWKLAGGVLRFGIPRRLDQRVRMELQYARGFSPLRDTLWSLEAVQ